MPDKRILLDKIEALDAKNALLLKTNAELVANARTAKRANKQLVIEGRYLSKTAAEELRAKEAGKEAQKEAKKAQALKKKAAAAARKAEQQQNKVLRQARAAAAAAEGGEKKRLPPRSRAQINYLLRIEEDVFE
ncbi:hypothetical protein GJ744_011409 [Endocarpon pusillum]|uniref:Uncharacterized protein n=1 Tax=Endocarpon pusillum TaxID=364733 RepID=A0A8H7AGX7_9EURO|nr:hypothetical protein GJ744_011409 [Endocarpon pusillum]